MGILAATARLLPKEKYLYYSDLENNPFGEKSEDEILNIAIKATTRLLNEGIKLLVVACNTVTLNAVDRLCSEVPIPVVGVEHGMEHALRDPRRKRVLTIASPYTIRRYQQWLAGRNLQGRELRFLALPNLATLVERGTFSGPQIEAEIAKIRVSARDDRFEADSLLLACTHFTLIREALRLHLPAMELVDTNDATALKIADELRAMELVASPTGGVDSKLDVSFISSKKDDSLAGEHARIFETVSRSLS